MPQMTIAEHDPWTHLPEASSEPSESSSEQATSQDYLIVPWGIWQADAESYRHIKHLAVHFPNDGDLTLLGDQLDQLPIQQLKMIVLDFPSFTDGRSYSIASALRQQYHYQGELRAVGEVLVDQVHFMWRCGFDSLAVQDAELAKTIINQPMPFTAFYQKAIQGDEPVYKKR